MKRLGAALALLASAPTLASAEGERPIQTGAALGYAFPAGRLERGSRVADVTHGMAVLAFDGAYRVHPSVSAGAALAYGAVVPTLCVTASDCTSSLGRDVTAMALARWHVGAWQAFEPTVDVSAGYEWLTTSLSDGGTTSSRRFRGFVAGADGDFLLRASPLFAAGLRLGVRGGTYHRASLDAPGVHRGSPTEGNALHLWPTIAARVVLCF